MDLEWNRSLGSLGRGKLIRSAARSGSLNLTPVVAFFLPMPVQLIAGILPPYWPMRALWSAALGEPWLGWLAVGALWGASAVLLALRLFERRMGRYGS